METIEKFDVKKMKEDIRKMSEAQVELKNQRRTIKLVGERKMEPYEATSKHMSNREKLRVLYAAYGIARGKAFSVTENKFPEDTHPLKEWQWLVDRILKKNTIKVQVESQIEE